MVSFQEQYAQTRVNGRGETGIAISYSCRIALGCRAGATKCVASFNFQCPDHQRVKLRWRARQDLHLLLPGVFKDPLIPGVLTHFWSCLHNSTQALSQLTSYPQLVINNDIQESQCIYWNRLHSLDSSSQCTT